MASGLRNKPYKSYRQVLGLKPVPPKVVASTSATMTWRKRSSKQSEVVAPEVEVDIHGEQGLFGEEFQESL